MDLELYLEMKLCNNLIRNWTNLKWHYSVYTVTATATQRVTIWFWKRKIRYNYTRYKIIHFIIKRNISFATSKVFIDYLSFLFKIIQLQLTLYKNFRSQTSDDKNFRFRFIGNPVFFSWQVAHRDLHVRTPVGKINWSDQLFSFISGFLLYLLCY